MTRNTELGPGVTLEKSLLMFEASRDGLCNRSALSKLHDPEAADGHELSRLVRVARQQLEWRCAKGQRTAK